MLLRLLLLICVPLCEPTVLLLIANPSMPIEGNSMTLTCKAQLPPEKLDVHLQFCFFKDGYALGLSWNNSTELQIPAVRREEDSGSYWCEAQAAETKVIKSKSIQIYVQRIPVYNVSLETQPPGGHVMEGEKLVLVCLVPGGTGDITFLWYKGVLGLNLETKTQRSLTAKFEIPMVRESDAEKYYCAADNGYGLSLSGLVSITVRIPVSRPVLTIRAPEAQNVVGDVIDLHCEAWRGSPPILYQFYHENVTMGNSSAPFGGGASFNLTLTADHFGNYFCEANNGLGAQRSEVVILNITVPPEDRRNLTSTLFEWLLGILGLTTMVLLFCCWLKRKIGKHSARDPFRSPPSPVLQGSTYVNSTSPVQLQPIYKNVNAVNGEEVYSLVYYMQQQQQSAAESLSTHTEDKDSSVIYSGLKRAILRDEDYEDAM
ncbi:Fc receptor-like protein 1 isoform X2 [Pteronotus mesoamericanus]|uniref:Fc receptor-like protein 1 isoform X2 n=1 Tax=Pteronotus mesoamericanus TaxID=1884717 RepID=UPI0023EC4601|nr:Fc receptor-like protein 1 isoform X2 [Pteronotus parnellii mesoamericanus]